MFTKWIGYQAWRGSFSRVLTPEPEVHPGSTGAIGKRNGACQLDTRTHDFRACYVGVGERFRTNRER